MAPQEDHPLVDLGTWRQLAGSSVASDPLGFPSYPDRQRAARDAGHDESLVIGTAELEGRPVILAIGDFGFLGGSMGVAHGHRLALAADEAARRRVPLLTVPRSGGARMQEGMHALRQMAVTTQAVGALRTRGVPHLTWLRHPSTGGVFASYASLADLAAAEPGATVGFAGPRVVEALTGTAPAGESHTAETALLHGLVDVLVEPAQARTLLATWTQLLHPQERGGALPTAEWPAEPTGSPDPWAAVHDARAARPTGRACAQALVDDWTDVRGDRAGVDDTALSTGLGRIGGRTVAVLAMEGREVTAAGYRKARRLLELARRHGLPVVSLVDTPGANPRSRSENAGLGSAIAEVLLAMLELPTPTIAVVIGEGGSGGALALAAADTLLMQEDAYFSVIGPEAASTILHRTPDRARELVGPLQVTAAALRLAQQIDRVLPGPVRRGTAEGLAALRAAVTAGLRELDTCPERAARRHRRFAPRPMPTLAVG